MARLIPSRQKCVVQVTPDASGTSQLWLPSSTALLYLTLVQGGALPSGYQSAFESLADAIEDEANRETRKVSLITNVSAAVSLQDIKRRKQREVRAEKAALDQFALASTLKPRRFSARIQQSRHQGPTARKDAKEAERQTCFGHSDTNERDPRAEPGEHSAFRLRARVRVLRRFLAWLAIHHEKVYPTEVTQLTDFLKVRLSEPCTRGALKLAHQALGFPGGNGRSS